MILASSIIGALWLVSLIALIKLIVGGPYYSYDFWPEFLVAAMVTILVLSTIAGSGLIGAWLVILNP